MNRDINGEELILDVDGDTSITADTDDQIDIKIAGADDFKFSANAMNVLSGSTLTIDSGATITNSGTATGFPGITMADQWRLNANKTGTGVISANLERVDTDGYGQLGTGMTESSGNFTFPSTGIYLIGLTIATDNNVNVSIETTQDNSSYNAAAVAKADSSTQTGTTQFIFDVTDTSTHKVNFNVFSISGTLQGSTDLNNTSFTFIRLGDT
jgi:hypothetical protein